MRLVTPVLPTALCKSCKKLRFLRLFAGFFMEESCRGFFASNWLYSNPGRSLGERIKLTFATAPGCLHSLSLGRHDCFGRLCNLGLSKKQRFSLQRHKTWEFGLLRIPEIVCRFFVEGLSGVLWGLYWLWYCGFFCSLRGQTVLEKNSRNKKTTYFKIGCFW